MGLPTPINWLRESRVATGEIYLVQMIDEGPNGSLSSVKKRKETRGYLEYYEMGIITPNKIERVKNIILNRMLEVNPDLTSVGNSPHLIWSLMEEDPAYWELLFWPKGRRPKEDYYVVATLLPWRLNTLQIAGKKEEL